MTATDEHAIRCTGLGKSYGIGTELSFQRTLARLAGRAPRTPSFAALDDVTFSVGRGEFFGIVGANGSGKSTLTQLISGITVPSAGRVDVWGRVLPLLEVGAGFHDELTGRENVTLLATILGLGRGELAAAMPVITDFSGVSPHLDTPLKRYSSGMRARLSFATAVCFPADVYVFDEVLAVVDDEFRDRCLARLRDLHAAGRTVLLMSHDLALIRRACRSGMWLDHGRTRVVGDIADVADAYEASGRGAAPASALG